MPDQPELTPPTPPEGENYEDNFIEEAADAPADASPVVPAAPVTPPPAQPAAPVVTVTPVETPAAETPPSRVTLPPVVAAAPSNPGAPADNFSERLERLGGEPAPVITPEEFSRLQNAGQVHIDAMGRVRTARRASQADAGVTLRKRRAWYSS